MYNPFEPETLRWHLFNELAETLSGNGIATTLELAEIVNDTAESEHPPPPRPARAV